jgi:hypothetical protein
VYDLRVGRILGAKCDRIQHLLGDLADAFEDFQATVTAVEQGIEVDHSQLPGRTAVVGTPKADDGNRITIVRGRPASKCCCFELP